MKLGFKPKEGESYLCRPGYTGIIEDMTFREHRCYLIPKIETFRGRFLHHIVYIDDWFNDIDEKLIEIENKFCTPTQIILNLDAFLGVCAQASSKSNKPHIELISEYKGIPVSLCRTEERIQICVELGPMILG